MRRCQRCHYLQSALIVNRPLSHRVFRAAAQCTLTQFGLQTLPCSTLGPNCWDRLGQCLDRFYTGCLLPGAKWWHNRYAPTLSWHQYSLCPGRLDVGQSGPASRRESGAVERPAGEIRLTGRLLFTHRLVVISPTQSFGDRQTKTDRATNNNAYSLWSPTFHKVEFEVKIYFFYKFVTWSDIWIPEEELFFFFCTQLW